MYKVNNIVWVAGNTYTERWSSVPTIINLIDELGYLVEVPLWGQFGESISPHKIVLTEHEIFSTKAECDEHIKNYYFDGECHGCQYFDTEHPETETNFNCRECWYQLDGKCMNYETHCNEICDKYTPILPQYKTIWKDFDHYLELMRNCTYNQECPLHKYSCHKNCTFDRWSNGKVSLRYPNMKYSGRDISTVKVLRKDYWYGGFIKGNKLLARHIIFEPEKTPRGRVRNGTYNQGMSFDDGEWIEFGGNE